MEYDTELNRKSSLLVELSPLFVYKVLKDNKLDGYDIQLVTGLSLKDWNDKTLKELNNVITTAVVNGEKVLNQNIKILPQGRGLAYDYFRNKKEEGNILVFDIGYNTFDLIHINKGVTSPRTSFANEMGVHCVVDRIRQHLLNNKIDWSSSEINDLLVENKLIFKVNGKPIDITEVYKESVVDYIKQLNLKCVSEIKPLMERADILLFGGGGAYILKQLKRKEIADIFFFTLLANSFSIHNMSFFVFLVVLQRHALHSRGSFINRKLLHLSTSFPLRNISSAFSNFV